MNFNAKEIILFATVFALGAAIYMMGNVLNDFDIAIAQLKVQVEELSDSMN